VPWVEIRLWKQIWQSVSISAVIVAMKAFNGFLQSEPDCPHHERIAPYVLSPRFPTKFHTHTCIVSQLGGGGVRGTVTITEKIMMYRDGAEERSLN
jgi:hypothetical protein